MLQNHKRTSPFQIQKSKDHPAHSLLVNEELHSLSHIIDCQCYSTMHRLLRVTAYVLRFVNNLRKTNGSDNSHTRALSSTEISEAKSFWIKEAQTSLTEHSKFQCWKQQLNLFLNPCGVWRCGGQNIECRVTVLHEAPHPVTLGSLSHFTHHSESSRESPSQWCEGNSIEILDHQGKINREDNSAQVCHLPEIRRKKFPRSTITPFTQVPSEGGASIYLHRC